MTFNAVQFFGALVFSMSAAFVSTNVQAADFIGDHEALFRNQELCASDLPEQVQDFGRFMALYEAVKAEKKLVEVVEYGAYVTEIEDLAVNERCAIIRHEDCFSAQCY